MKEKNANLMKSNFHSTAFLKWVITPSTPVTRDEPRGGRGPRKGGGKGTDSEEL